MMEAIKANDLETKEPEKKDLEYEIGVLRRACAVAIDCVKRTNEARTMNSLSRILSEITIDKRAKCGWPERIVFDTWLETYKALAEGYVVIPIGSPKEYTMVMSTREPTKGVIIWAYRDNCNTPVAFTPEMFEWKYEVVFPD